MTVFSMKHHSEPKKQPPTVEKPAPLTPDNAKLRQIELAISLILRIGVGLSAAIIILGIGLFFVTGQSGYAFDQQLSTNTNPFANYREVQNNPQNYFPINLVEVISGILALKSFAVIALGLFSLILTPILRVAASLVAFAIERDWAYVFITLFVLSVLVASFLIGKAGG